MMCVVQQSDIQGETNLVGHQVQRSASWQIQPVMQAS